MAKLSNFGKENNNNQEKVSEETIKEKYNEYKDMSAKDLNQELFNEVARQKSQGKFNYNQLAGMVENLRPSLSNEQYQNIKRILESLK